MLLECGPVTISISLLTYDSGWTLGLALLVFQYYASHFSVENGLKPGVKLKNNVLSDPPGENRNHVH